MTTTPNPNAALASSKGNAPAQARLSTKWRETVRAHWPEYAMEAALLGTFMVSACSFGALLEYPGSPVRIAIADPMVRRALAGVAMGLTALGIFYSPWGKQSGAHMNPSVTLAFLWLGKISRIDAIFYIASHFIGSAVAVAAVGIALRGTLADRAVNFVATVPGSRGTAAALIAELVISFLMMSVVLYANNHDSLHKLTGAFAATLVAVYISIESPLSGMSMNAARTFGSALSAHTWTAYWIYVVAPLAGMLSAAALHVSARSQVAVKCAKFHHENDKRCIHCGANGGHHRD